MAVVSVRERFYDRAAEFAGQDASSTDRTWLVTTDSKYDTPLTIRAQTTSTLPIYLSPHPENVFYTCRRLTIQPVENSAKAWIASATYASSPLNQEDQDRSSYPNPLLRPTRTTSEGVPREKYANKDRDGIAFTNSAGDYFPAQVVDDDRVVINLTRFVAARFASIFSFSNSVNEAVYSVDGWTIPTGCGKIGRFKYSELMEENGFQYYTLSAEIQVVASAEDWDISLLDEGFNAYDRVRAKYKILIPNDDGEPEPPSEPVPLDGSGSKLDEEDPLYGDGGGVFRSWHYYREKDWSQLPF